MSAAAGSSTPSSLERAIVLPLVMSTGIVVVTLLSEYCSTELDGSWQTLRHLCFGLEASSTTSTLVGARNDMLYRQTSLHFCRRQTRSNATGIDCQWSVEVCATDRLHRLKGLLRSCGNDAAIIIDLGVCWPVPARH